jgi:hypothetical protein
MANLYIGNDFDIQLTLGQDMTGGTASIRYKIPGSATVNSKAATVSNYTTGVCTIHITKTEHTTKGAWVAWLKVIFADGDETEGDPITFTSYEGGNI